MAVAEEDYRDDPEYREAVGIARWLVYREKELRRYGLWEEYGDRPLTIPGEDPPEP